MSKGDRPGRLFDSPYLLANTVLTGFATGAAMGSLTGMLWLAIVGAIIGGLVCYLLINNIPSETD
ncbi:MAG: hypothetical protein AAF220_02320 [Pseudomonadota bacterium]